MVIHSSLQCPMEAKGDSQGRYRANWPGLGFSGTRGLSTVHLPEILDFRNWDGETAVAERTILLGYGWENRVQAKQRARRLILHTSTYLSARLPNPRTLDIHDRKRFAHHIASNSRRAAHYCTAKSAGIAHFAEPRNAASFVSCTKLGQAGPGAVGPYLSAHEEHHVHQAPSDSSKKKSTALS